MESSFDAFVYGPRNSVSSLPSVTSLPPYTRRPSPPPRPLTEHVVELSSNISSVRAKKPWATLRVYSKAPAGSLPTFVEGESITGSVTLDSTRDNSRHISSVKVMVRGELSTGAHAVERLTFLDSVPVTLWSKDVRETRGSRQHWPFSIGLPRRIVASPGTVNNSYAYSLPPTFMERRIRASIRYNLIVHIQRKKFRGDSDLQTAFIYVPAIEPDPPSPLRSLAYQENSVIPSPEIDPKGWYSLPSAKVEGKLFNNHMAQVSCRLSLATPLSYTRGSVIPLSLVLTSTDYQALDLLSSRQVLIVTLRRKVTLSAPNAGELLNAPSALQISTEPVEDIATAVWWRRPDDEAEIASARPRLSRELEGEILLSKSLKPTFHISNFGIEYSIAMLPFATTSFVPTQKFNNGPILEQRVQIATMYPKGPRPIAHSPPEYREQVRNTGRSLPPSRASLPPSRGR